MTFNRRTWITIAVAALCIAAGVAAWAWLRPAGLPNSIASGNGRIEAVEIDIATKAPGRIKAILVREGEFVTVGQVLARMDTDVLDAQRKEAEAQLQRAVIGVGTAENQVKQREAEQEAAAAVIAQRDAELNAAQRRLARSAALAPKNVISEQTLDDDRARFQSAKAALSAARAQVAAAQAAAGAARSQVVDAKATVEAARATIQRIQADIDDSVLKSPRDGRVQYLVAREGEVLAAGGRVLDLIDVGDIDMTFFLPTAEAGRVAIGAEARIVLDAAPQYVIPATVSFVADVAQFTPKTVETAQERQKLMFRVKARIAPELLRRYVTQVKTGLPGVAYVRLDPRVPWPAALQVKLPE